MQASVSQNGYSQTCPSVGACSCDGSGCPDYDLEEAAGYGWSVFDTSIAPITSGAYSQQATFYGNSVGQTLFYLSMYDAYSCYSSGQGPAASFN